LESYETELPNYDSAVVFAADDVRHDAHPVVAILDPLEVAFELNAWITGLTSFHRACSDGFRDSGELEVVDRSGEFRVSMAGLQKCSSLAVSLRKLVDGSGGDGDLGLTSRDVEQLFEQIRGLILLNRSISESNSPRPAEWSAWSSALAQQLLGSNSANRLATNARNMAKTLLPAELLKLYSAPEISFSDRCDISEIAAHIAAILKSLSIIERMLQRHQPLKPSLVIFAGIYEQTKQLIAFINNRLSRFPDEHAPLFNSLDSASYGASLELKKVFQQELRGVVRLAPPPSVHSRVETAYSLLLDSFQQMLIELAKIANPAVTPFEFFPRFKVKLDRSIELRSHLWNMLRSVQAAEGEPNKENVEKLRTMLRSFSEGPIRNLHFKDQETVERFTEEVHAARDKQGLVPILHRFGAYLETLFGQVSMRAVLEGHPFTNSN